MAQLFDHVDLRVSDLGKAGPFYRALLPALGFTLEVEIEGWLQFETPDEGATEFFGITEQPGHLPNQNRIAFRAESPSRVDALALLVTRFGAQHIEGPALESASYYAVYFEDPVGNRLEICHRSQKLTETERTPIP